MIHPRNSFTTVPQASTPRCHSDFRVFATLFPNFRAFYCKFPLFRLKGLREPLSIIFLSSLKFRGYFCHHTDNANLELRSAWTPTKKCSKNTKIRLFLQKSPFSSLKSVPLGTLQKRVTDLHQRFPMKKGANSKFPRTMIHLGDIAGPRGCIFATQFLHAQTS